MDILEAIHHGALQPSQVVSILNVSFTIVSHHLRRLEKEGYIIRKRKGIITELALTQKGILAIMEKNITSSNYVNTSVGIDITSTNNVNMNNSTIQYRIHDLTLSFKLRNEVSPPEFQTLITGSKLVPMKNHVDLVLEEETYKARIYPSTLTITLPDILLPLGSDMNLAINGLMDRVEPIVESLEARLGISAVRIDKDTLQASLTNLHIALMHHDFAETINDKGEKLYVYDDNDVLRVIVDKSHGLHEYEAIAPQFAPEDAQKLGDLTKDVIQGKWDYKKEHDILHTTVEQLNALASQTNSLASNFNAHIPYFQSAEAVNKKLLERMDKVEEQQKTSLWKKILKRFKG